MNPLSDLHQQLLNEALTDAQTDAEVIGVMLQGSLARGDGYAGSDVDLLVLLRDGYARPFRAQMQNGILVEWHYADKAKAIAKVQTNPMLAYGYNEGRILRDDTGDLAQIAQFAAKVIADYCTPQAELEGIVHWLQSAQVKIQAAHSAGDTRKAAFVVATTSWTLLSGVWAVNDLPMPPSGSVVAHRHDLKNVPNDWLRLFDQLFTSDTEERIQAARTLIAWVLQSASRKGRVSTE